jgi:threonine/homoserine/homoserine lactone efflux protein
LCWGVLFLFWLGLRTTKQGKGQSKGQSRGSDQMGRPPVAAFVEPVSFHEAIVRWAIRI